MSKERIDEIIREHINISYKTNIEHIRRTRKAMEQYGKERYQQGILDQEKVESFKLKILGEKLASQKQLIKAQKELIEYLEESAATYDTNCDLLLYAHDLRNKIKTLEQ